MKWLIFDNNKPTANTVHTQIVVGNDKQLLPESEVDVKGIFNKSSNIQYYV